MLEFFLSEFMHSVLNDQLLSLDYERMNPEWSIWIDTVREFSISMAETMPQVSFGN